MQAAARAEELQAAQTTGSKKDSRQANKGSGKEAAPMPEPAKNASKKRPQRKQPATKVQNSNVVGDSHAEQQSSSVGPSGSGNINGKNSQHLESKGAGQVGSEPRAETLQNETSMSNASQQNSVRKKGTKPRKNSDGSPTN